MSGTAVRQPYIAWLPPAVVNLIFGCIGVFPLGFLWIFLSEYPLAALGVTERNPTNNDGFYPWLILLVAGVGSFIAVWAGINFLLWRALKLHRRCYWVASAILLLAPFTVLAIFPDIGNALGLF
ncbi:hypothetical protein AB0M95_16820 [Sphaerisporangium sp. NPDC051017]|uniref:hypothetical protein n=1 Tax=Sphaerisporangium sp. NPDC051017 TaxID=3154636 RepID=UPI003442F706